MFRQAQIDRLMGRGTNLFRPADITAPDGGGKFTPQGNVLRFPGNTFICHIDKASAAFAALAELKQGLATGPSARFFAFLPAESFHMTVFCGVCGDPLGADGWPENIPAGATLAQITHKFRATLDTNSGFARANIAPRDLHLGYSLRVEGADAHDEAILRAARTTLQNATGLHRPDFKSYRFHISFCYQLAWMSEKDAEAHLSYADVLYAKFAAMTPTITLGPIEFCTFETMFHFEPLMTVKPAP